MRKAGIDRDCHRIGRGVGADHWAGCEPHGVRNLYSLAIDLLFEIEVNVTSLLIELEDGGGALIGLQDWCILTGTDVVGCEPGACGNVWLIGGDG